MKKTLAGLVLILSLSTFAMADEGRGMMGSGMMGSGMTGSGMTGGGMMGGGMMGSGMMGSGMMGSGMMGSGMTGSGMMGSGMMGSGMMGSGMMGSGMMGSGMGMGGTPWFHHGVSLTLMNSDKLGLDENQKQQLEGIRTKYTKELIRQSAEVQIAELDIISLLRADTVDLSKVRSTIKKKNDIESQVRYLRIEAFEEARKVLTDEQKGKLKKLMENPALMMRDKAKGMMEGMMGGGKMDKGQK